MIMQVMLVIFVLICVYLCSVKKIEEERQRAEEEQRLAQLSVQAAEARVERDKKREKLMMVHDLIL